MKKIKYDNINEIIYYEKLSNGIDVYMYPNEKSKNFYITFNTKFGSMDTEFRYESSNEIINVPQGSAHFLEHLMFQEDDNHTAFETFASLGSSVNAFTTYDMTCYEVIGSNHFKDNLEELLDFVQHPVFKNDKVNNEKDIIREEIKMYDNDPNSKSAYKLEYNLNIKDRHKYLISGNIDDIKNICPNDLYICYDAFYQPKNMFIIITGKFKPLEALGIIKENQKNKEFNEYEKVIKINYKEPLEVENNYEKISMDINNPKIKLAYKISKNDFSNYKTTELKVYLDAILNIKFSQTSNLYERLIKNNLISSNIETNCEIRKDYILIKISTESEYIEETIEEIRKEFKNIKINKEDLDRIKKVYISNFIIHFDDIIEVMESIQDDIMTNNSINTNILNIYKKLNIVDANLIASLINTENESIYIVNKNN